MPEQTLDDRLNEIFRYHPPTEEQKAKYHTIRDAAKRFAKIMIENTPASADQSAALRKLRECVMTANASIALDGAF